MDKESIRPSEGTSPEKGQVAGLTPEEFIYAVSLLESLDNAWAAMPPDLAKERKTMYTRAQQSVVDAKNFNNSRRYGGQALGGIVDVIEVDLLNP